MIAYFPTYLPLFVIIMIAVTRRPLHILRRRGAITAETAQPVDDFNPRDRRRLDRLVGEGLIREASPGRFYYDVDFERARMRRRRPWLVALAAILLAVGFVLAFYNGRNVKPLP